MSLYTGHLEDILQQKFGVRTMLGTEINFLESIVEEKKAKLLLNEENTVSEKELEYLIFKLDGIASNSFFRIIRTRLGERIIKLLNGAFETKLKGRMLKIQLSNFTLITENGCDTVLSFGYRFCIDDYFLPIGGNNINKYEIHSLFPIYSQNLDSFINHVVEIFYTEVHEEIYRAINNLDKQKKRDKIIGILTSVFRINQWKKKKYRRLALILFPLTIIWLILTCISIFFFKIFYGMVSVPYGLMSAVANDFWEFWNKGE